ncbi:MAG: hypothetical protein SPL94_03635 [Oribacterium sp.]|nr:hypothetical protein [Oribacterium sp.]
MTEQQVPRSNLRFDRRQSAKPTDKPWVCRLARPQVRVLLRPPEQSRTARFGSLLILSVGKMCQENRPRDKHTEPARRKERETLLDFLKTHQLNIMLFMSGICGILVVLTVMTRTLSSRRRCILALLEAAAMFLLIADRYAYIYRGDPSPMGFWMVRISNFLVYFLTLYITEDLCSQRRDRYLERFRD